MADNGAAQYPVTGRFGGRVQLSDSEMRVSVGLLAGIDQLAVSIQRRLLAAAKDGRPFTAEIGLVCDITLVNPEDAQVGEHVSEFSALSYFKPSGGNLTDGPPGEPLSFQRQPTGLWERVQ